MWFLREISNFDFILNRVSLKITVEKLLNFSPKNWKTNSENLKSCLLDFHAKGSWNLLLVIATIAWIIRFKLKEIYTQ